MKTAQGVRDHISIYGTDYPTPDGTCLRDYIHVLDLADAHVLAMKYLAGGGVSDVFNLGSENGFSVREIIEVAKKVTGVDFKVVEEGRRSGDPAALIASSAKCKRHWDGIRQEAVQKRLLPQHGNGICHILTDMAGKNRRKACDGV